MLHSRKTINSSHVISLEECRNKVILWWRPLVIRPFIVARVNAEGGSYAGNKLFFMLFSFLFSPTGRSNRIEKMPGLSMMFGEWKFTCLWELSHLQYWLCWL